MPSTFTVSTHINAPLEHVFEVMTDLENAPKWMTNLVGMEKKSAGPYGVGTEWSETRKMFGREATEVCEVTDYVPNERVGLYIDGTKGSSGKGQYRFTQTVEKEGAGTKVTISCNAEVPGRLGGLMTKIVGRFIVRSVRKDLASMKAYAEGITTA